MKKICAVFVLFLISFLFVGCNNYVDAYYFMFVRDNLSCEVGDTINICELESNTNIKTYEHMHIYTNDSDIAQINNNDFSVKLLKEGNVTIFISGKYSNDILTDSIVFNVSSSNNGLGDNNGGGVEDGSNNNDGNGNTDGDNDEGGSGEGSSGDNGSEGNIFALTYQIVSENVVSGKNVVSYNILANKQNYSNFSYQVLSSDDNNLSVFVYSSIIEIAYNINSNIEIEIFDNLNIDNSFVLTLS